MIIFLYGPDDYRRAQKKKSIIAEFEKKRSGLGLGYFNLEEKDSLDSLGGFLRNQPMFEATRLAVVENAFEIEAAKLSAVIKPFVAEKGLQILLCEKDKPLKALAFLLEKPVVPQKFEALAGAEFARFIKEEGKNRGVVFADSAALFLATVYAGNSWGAMTEVEKLSSLKGVAGDGLDDVHDGVRGDTNATRGETIIEKCDLDALGLEAAPNYWGLLNGMKSFDLRARLSALETLFSVNDPPAKIFNILSAQAGERVPLMAAYDLAVKSGKLEYDEVLVDLALG